MADTSDLGPPACAAVYSLAMVAILVSLVFDQFIKQFPIMDHSLPQLFRAGFAALVSDRDIMTCAIVLYDFGMID